LLGFLGVTRTVLSRAGERLDAERVREDVLRLAAFSELEEVAVTAERRGEDTVVVVSVTPVPRVAAVVVERRGRASCEPPPPLAICGHLRAADLRRASAALEAEAASRGEGTVDVSYDVKPVGEGLVRVRVGIAAGAGGG
jgi:outer membrane protein assembly factor BamA